MGKDKMLAQVTAIDLDEKTIRLRLRVDDATMQQWVAYLGNLVEMPLPWPAEPSGDGNRQASLDGSTETGGKNP